MAKLEREIEIKLKVTNAAAARRLLQRAGFSVRRRRMFEDNIVFDTPELAVVRNGGLLRVREVGRRATLTYKGPAMPGKYKSREELEMCVPDAQIAGAILNRLGFRPIFRYQKYRTEFYQLHVNGVVMLDETPVGAFLELEGAPRWIDRTARSLGFRESDYITASYGALYRQFCDMKGVAPGNMVFAACDGLTR